MKPLNQGSHIRRPLRRPKLSVLGLSLLIAGCGNLTGQPKAGERSASVKSQSDDASVKPEMTVEDVVQGFEMAEELPDQVISPEDKAAWQATLVDEDLIKPSEALLSSTSFQLDSLEPDQREVIDLRSNDTPIRNQGSEGTCTAFATVATMENLVKRLYGQTVDLSERHHWTTYADYQSTTSLRKASTGTIVSESVWPYQGRKPSSISGLGIAKINSYSTTQLSLEPIVASLRNGQPVVIAVGVLSSMMNPKQGGIITGGSQQGRTGHALAITGAIIDSRVAGGGYFILKNSWGKNWGDNGYGYASFDYCKRTWCSAYSVADVSLYNNGVEEPKPSVVPSVEPSIVPEPTPSASPTVAPSVTPTVSPTATPTIAPTVTPTPNASITAADFVLKGHPSYRRGLFGRTSFYLSVNAKPEVMKQIRSIQYSSSSRKYTVYNGASQEVAVSAANLASPDFRTFEDSFRTENVIVKLRNGQSITLKGINIQL